MNHKVFFFLLSIVFSGTSCNNSVARKPVRAKSATVLDKTVELHKRNLERENSLIENYIKNDSLFQYQMTKKGFWYAYKLKNDVGETPKKGDLVVFQQEITNLADEILHSREELGEKKYIVDKEHIINGIQEGIKLMRVGEEMKFIFSSYVAYSTSGDKSNKIGVHEPIINTIKLINIKNQE